MVGYGGMSPVETIMEPDTYERDQLLIEEQHRRRAHQRYLSAPDCADPDHPGCPLCEGDDE